MGVVTTYAGDCNTLIVCVIAALRFENGFQSCKIQALTKILVS
jgi:hypothetical protein